MSEEKEQEKSEAKTEVKQEVKKEESKAAEHPAPEEKKAPPAEGKGEVPPKAPAEAKEKRRKISKMALKEVEAQIIMVQEKMGGLLSDHGRALLARKSELESQKE